MICILYWPFTLLIAWLPSVSIYYFWREIVAPVRHEPAFCTMPSAGWLTKGLNWPFLVIRWYFNIFEMKYIKYVFNIIKSVYYQLQQPQLLIFRFIFCGLYKENSFEKVEYSSYWLAAKRHLSFPSLPPFILSPPPSLVFNNSLFV